MCKAFSKKQNSFLEIACGPGMGLAPIILSEFPNVSCLVTDASSLLIKSWRKFIDEVKFLNITDNSYYFLFIYQKNKT